MSYVTNVMLHYSLDDEDDRGIDRRQINDVIGPLNSDQVFEHITGNWGGRKFPEVILLAAAFNFWDEEATKDVLAKLPWRRPDLVQLFICDQEDDAFSLYTLHTLEGTPSEPERHVWVQRYDGRDL